MIEEWCGLKRGDTVRMSAKPIGAQDAQIAAQQADRLAAMVGFTKPHLYAEIAFYGDAPGRTWIVHPESLELIRRSGA